MLEEEQSALPPPGLSKERKAGFVLLLIFGIMSVGLGFLQIRNSLYAPFALNNKVSVALKDEVNTIDALRLRDTDHDGLSDFDELYVYGTSPYLYDTFSYGISDKEVITRGLPLCPKGQDCASPATTGETNVGGGASGTPRYAPPDTLGPPPADLLKTLTDPKQVRQMLAGSGTDPKILNKISDADLMVMVNQLLANTTTVASLQSLNNFVTTGTPK